MLTALKWSYCGQRKIGRRKKNWVLLGQPLVLIMYPWIAIADYTSWENVSFVLNVILKMLNIPIEWFFFFYSTKQSVSPLHNQILFQFRFNLHFKIIMKQKTFASLLVTWGFLQRRTRGMFWVSMSGIYSSTVRKEMKAFLLLQTQFCVVNFTFLEGYKWGRLFVCSYHLLIFNLSLLL